MFTTKLSKGFVITVCAVLAFWFLGPHILFSASEKVYENDVRALHKLGLDRKESVAASIERLSIKDAALYRCIKETAMARASINPINSGGIDDVNELKMLHCRLRGINSLAGIEQLTGLAYLDISKNSIKDISPLGSLLNLSSLNIRDNPIREISILGSLTQLHKVSLPNLPHVPCKKVMAEVKGKKTNASNIDCKGQDIQSITSAVFEQQKSTPSQKRPMKLSDREEELLFDYENDMKARMD